jgi:hypothetical protein
MGWMHSSRGRTSASQAQGPISNPSIIKNHVMDIWLYPFCGYYK